MHYMRNQLLRDADWAGMAHGVEIRVPLVDTALLKAVAPVLPGLKPGAGKAALARAPTLPLGADVLRRAKTGFGVPTAVWTDTPAAAAPAVRAARHETRGLASRRWSRRVMACFAEPEAGTRA
jgi:asparagine synthase (glutamine-hydrolysing)